MQDEQKKAQIRYINAPLRISFSPVDDDIALYQKEFRRLSAIDEDSVGEWLKITKAKGEMGDSDEVVLKLLVELHRKVDYLTKLTLGEENERLKLQHSKDICKIAYGYFMLEDELLEMGKEYYARIEMPVFPKREIALFVQAISKTECKITNIHSKDEADWNMHLAARERMLIREMRMKKNDS